VLFQGGVVCVLCNEYIGAVYSQKIEERRRMI